MEPADESEVALFIIPGPPKPGSPVVDVRSAGRIDVGETPLFGGLSDFAPETDGAIGEVTAPALDAFPEEGGNGRHRT